MKITYEFDPYEDRSDLEIHQQAIKMNIVIHQFAHNVKSRTASLEGEKLEGYELAMKHFYEIMEEEGLKTE